MPKRNNPVVWISVVIVFLSGVLTAGVLKADPVPLESLKPPERFTTCIDKNLGYRISCSPNWLLETKPKGISLLINDEPDRLVTLTINQHEEDGLALHDLTPAVLKKIFLYEDHFRIGKTTIGNEKGIVVESVLLDFPEVMVLDYFFLKNNFLYRVSFSVNKKDAYAEFKPLFRQLIKSFAFSTNIPIPKPKTRPRD